MNFLDVTGLLVQEAVAFAQAFLRLEDYLPNHASVCAALNFLMTFKHDLICNYNINFLNTA